MRYKVIVFATVAAMIAVVPGCNKKGNQLQVKKGSGILETNKKGSGDTSDVFKEFYSEDTAGQGTSKKGAAGAASKNQTFSPSSPSSSSPSVSSGEFLENGRYVVQVSCVKSKSFAEKIAAALKEKNFPAYVAEVQNPTPALSGTYYRIRIGGFGGYSAAKSFGDKTLVPSGYEYWIDKKSNDNTGMEGYGLGSGAPSASQTPPQSTSSSSSWSSAPVEAPPAESPSPSAGMSAGNAPSSSAAPSPGTGAAAPAAVPAPSNTPSPAAAASPSPAAPAAPEKAASGTKQGNAAESSEWGSDSSASGGW
jgi:hypothetical protein